MKKTVHFPCGKVEQDTLPGRWRSHGVGIDCHSRMVWACVLVPDYAPRELQRHLIKFQTTPAGLAALREWLTRLVPPHARTFVIESTSTYHYPVLLALPEWTPVVINPMLAGSAKRKTDRWDAHQLAYHCLCGTFQPYIPPTERERVLRTLLRRRQKLQRAATRLSNGLLSGLCLFGINPLLRLRPKHGQEVLAAILAKKRLEQWAQTEEEMHILQGLQPAVDALPARVVWMLERMYKELLALYAEGAETLAAAVQEADSPVVEILQGLSGVGVVASLTFLAEIGFDPRRRFRNLKAAIAYAGFDPSKRVSADKQTSHIPTAGSRHMKQAFVQAGQAALRSKDAIGAYGQSVLSRTRKYKSAVYAVGRKLVALCYHLALQAVGATHEQAPFADGDSSGPAARPARGTQPQRPAGGGGQADPPEPPQRREERPALDHRDVRGPGRKRRRGTGDRRQ
jgi:transposase